MPAPSDTIDIALRSIRGHALRAFLTMLGIIIGVAAVITMVALGNGAQRAIEERIDALGAQVLTIYAGQHYTRGIASVDRAGLTSGNALALARDPALPAELVPEIAQTLPIKSGNQNIQASVVGTTPNFPNVRNYQMALGRMFSAGEGEARRRYAVVGSAIPGLLGQSGAAMLGETLYLRGIPFEIIGVLAEKGSEGSWNDPDEQLLIPLQTAQFRVFGTDRLRSIHVKLADGFPTEQAMVEIERILRREHRILPGEPNDFRIRDRQEILATQQETSEIFAYLLASVAAVSLVVGGIGIMNIMLVSVTERTREIGVRKALGATRTDVLFQFLVEALLLCLVGGVLGVLVGTLVSLGLAHFAGWQTWVSIGSISLSFGFSAAIGIGFGLWPARRAAALHPVDALRYE